MKVEEKSARSGPSRVLLPLLNPALAPPLLELGALLAGGPGGEVVVVTVAEVADAASLSQGMPLARAYRVMMEASGHALPGIEARTLVRVSDDVAAGIGEAARETESDLLLLPWKGFAREPDRVFGRVIDRLLADPPCDVALVRLPVPTGPWRVLVAARGGSYAELAVELGQRLTADRGGLTVVHAAPPARSRADRPFEPVRARLADVATTARLIEPGGDPRTAILGQAQTHDLVILGASGRPDAATPLGPLGERLARDLRKGLLVVKTRAPLRLPADGAPAPEAATGVSGRVDHWFAENTFHFSEFADIARLVDLKRKRGLTVSLGLPTLDDAASIMGVLKATRGLLQQEYPLLDEIAILDRGSADGTREIARELGVAVHRVSRVLPRRGGGDGTGDALWKSLHILRGDLVVWLDPEIRNPHPRFVYGLLGPLLADPDLAWVKGFSHRPAAEDDAPPRGAASPDIERSLGGGGVTELVVRPLLNLLVPELSGLIQPLSTQRAGRRDVLERVPFFGGRGAEAGLLLDVYAVAGLRGIGQVDLGERIGPEREPREADDPEVARTANAVLQVLLLRLGERHGLGLPPINRSMKRIRCEHDQYFLDVHEVAEEERPPMVSLAAYRRRVGGRQ